MPHPLLLGSWGAEEEECFSLLLPLGHLAHPCLRPVARRGRCPVVAAVGAPRIPVGLVALGTGRGLIILDDFSEGEGERDRFPVLRGFLRSHTMQEG